MRPESPEERARGFVSAAERRVRALSPEQLLRRDEINRRTMVIAGGVRRGPAAPADGTFGGVRKAKS